MDFVDEPTSHMQSDYCELPSRFVPSLGKAQGVHDRLCLMDNRSMRSQILLVFLALVFVVGATFLSLKTFFFVPQTSKSDDFNSQSIINTVTTPPNPISSDDIDLGTQYEMEQKDVSLERIQQKQSEAITVPSVPKTILVDDTTPATVYIPSSPPSITLATPTCDMLIEENELSFAGNDVDKNGVRDDVDCYITEWYGLKTESSVVARRYAKALQAALMGEILYTTEELRVEELQDEAYFRNPLVRQFTEALSCAMYLDIYKTELYPMSRIDRAILNTPERSKSYALLFTGALIGAVDEEDCNRQWMNE